jgi:digeranylgeranylglycerophospholipid reductase
MWKWGFSPARVRVTARGSVPVPGSRDESREAPVRLHTHDVVIVGAGPAGLFAAARLASAGLDVAVLEEHAEAGVPVHCTGVLADDAFDEFGLTRQSVLNPLTRARFYAPSGDSIGHETEDVEAVVIDRRTFDQELHNNARAAGARILTKHRATAIAVESGGVRVALRDRNAVAGRSAILACGANYGLARGLGLGLPSAWLQSAQMELAAAHAGDVEVHFGTGVAPRGFAWAVPVARPTGQFVRVGLMCEGAPGDHFSRFVRRLAPRWGIAGPACSGSQAPRLKMLPLAPIPRTFTDRVLAVGDAAGLVKATTGGGIYYSLVSAAMAADVLGPALRAGHLDAEHLGVYERRWRSRLGPELDAQLSLRRLAHRLDDTDIDGFFQLARTDGIMPLVRRTARFNQHRHLIRALFKHQPARDILFKRLADSWLGPLARPILPEPAGSGSQPS